MVTAPLFKVPLFLEQKTQFPSSQVNKLRGFTKPAFWNRAQNKLFVFFPHVPYDPALMQNDIVKTVQ